MILLRDFQSPRDQVAIDQRRLDSFGRLLLEGVQHLGGFPPFDSVGHDATFHFWDEVSRGG